ncbi:hypothetical protein FQR65_LT06574 [Abscondita terminalis]|nr:hypothetical protein FQR65_LT06574 [Abscondita terminalis]
MTKALFIFMLLTQLGVIYNNVQDECLKENGLSVNEFRKESLEFQISDTNPKIGEYYLCVWKKRKIMLDDGSIDKDRYNDFFVRYIGGYRNYEIDEENRADLIRILNSVVSYEGKNDVTQAINLMNGLKMGLFIITFSDREVGTDPLELFLRLK